MPRSTRDVFKTAERWERGIESETVHAQRDTHWGSFCGGYGSASALGPELSGCGQQRPPAA